MDDCRAYPPSSAISWLTLNPGRRHPLERDEINHVAVEMRLVGHVGTRLADVSVAHVVGDRLYRSAALGCQGNSRVTQSVRSRHPFVDALFGGEYSVVAINAAGESSTTNSGAVSPDDAIVPCLPGS